MISGEAADEAVRAVLITGAGRGFSSGADLRAGFDPADDGMPDIHKELHDVYHPAILGIRRLPKPVVAAVNGPAVGIGCSLALACDLVMAAESAFFGLAFVNIGLMPDGGSTAFVPPAVGRARAFQMALLGERVPAAQALEWGLVNWVHPDAELLEQADSLVSRLAAGPTRSYAASKQALNRFDLRRSRRPARARGRASAPARADRRLRRGRRRVRRETRSRLHRPLDPAAISDWRRRTPRPAPRPTDHPGQLPNRAVPREAWGVRRVGQRQLPKVRRRSLEWGVDLSAPARRRAGRPGPSPPRGSPSY